MLDPNDFVLTEHEYDTLTGILQDTTKRMALFTFIEAKMLEAEGLVADEVQIQDLQKKIGAL